MFVAKVHGFIRNISSEPGIQDRSPKRQPSKFAFRSPLSSQNLMTSGNFQYVQCRGHSYMIGKPPFSSSSSAISTNLENNHVNNNLCFRSSLRHAGCRLLTVCHGEPPVQGRLAKTATLEHRSASLTLSAPASDVRSSSLVISTT